MYETFSGMLSRHNTLQLHPEQTRISSGLLNRDMRMRTPSGTRHYLAECYISVLPSLPFPRHSLDSPSAPQLSPHPTLHLLSLWRSKGWRENVARLIFNKWIQVKMNFKNSLKVEENSQSVCAEAERSSPAHLTWEIPGGYWLIILCVNFTWGSHLFLLPFSSLSRC